MRLTYRSVMSMDETNTRDSKHGIVPGRGTSPLAEGISFHNARNVTRGSEPEERVGRSRTGRGWCDLHRALAVHDHPNARDENQEARRERNQSRRTETAPFAASDRGERGSRGDTHAAERRHHDSTDELAGVARL